MSIIQKFHSLLSILSAEGLEGRTITGVRVLAGGIPIYGFKTGLRTAGPVVPVDIPLKFMCNGKEITYWVNRDAVVENSEVDLATQQSVISADYAKEWVANVYADMETEDVMIFQNMISFKAAFTGMDDTEADDIRMKIEEYLKINEGIIAKNINHQLL